MDFYTCRTCGKHIANPYRLYDENGKVVQGCISKDHDGQLVAGTESARWHNRKWARDQRRADKTLTLAQLEERAMADKESELFVVYCR